MTLPPLVLLAEPLPPEPTDWLAQHCRVARLGPDDTGFAAALAEADALVVRTATRVETAMLARAPRLRVIGRAGVGLETIDVAACRSRGVEVVHTPEANAQAVVEYVLWLIGDALRPRAALRGPLDAAAWERLRNDLTAPRQLDECTVGILGFGRIGRRVARAVSALGARTLCCDLVEFGPAILGPSVPVDAERLFAESDIVSIHVDGRPGNRGFVSGHLLSLLRDDAIVINTSRGLVIDEPALASSLAGRPRTLALLDVHDQEPVSDGAPLLGLPNCHLFPHLASRTASAVRAMGWVVRDVVRVLEGLPPDHRAPDPPSLEPVG